MYTDMCVCVHTHGRECVLRVCVGWVGGWVGGLVGGVCVWVGGCL
jgi:hypothetical protein